MCLAIPGKILSLHEENSISLRRGKVDFGGIHREVCLDFTPDAKVGNYVLVHVGFAIAVVDEAEALEVFEALQQLGQLDELTQSPQ